MWSLQGSAVIGTSIFLLLAPNIVLVPIFVENLTFLNFGGVGHGCGRSTGRRLMPNYSLLPGLRIREDTAKKSLKIKR